MTKKIHKLHFYRTLQSTWCGLDITDHLHRHEVARIDMPYEADRACKACIRANRAAR